MSRISYTKPSITELEVEYATDAAIGCAQMEALTISSIASDIDARVFFHPLSSLDMVDSVDANQMACDLLKRAINLPIYHDIFDEDHDRRRARQCSAGDSGTPLSTWHQLTAGTASQCFGAGAVVVRDAPAGATVIGNPARIMVPAQN